MIFNNQNFVLMLFLTCLYLILLLYLEYYFNKNINTKKLCTYQQYIRKNVILVNIIIYNNIFLIKILSRYSKMAHASFETNEQEGIEGCVDDFIDDCLDEFLEGNDPKAKVFKRIVIQKSNQRQIVLKNARGNWTLQRLIEALKDEDSDLSGFSNFTLIYNSHVLDDQVLYELRTAKKKKKTKTFKINK
ncbi:hypothetical protein RFI_05707 [Reticulomyxa filosa]|uniref:Uncharacterized protein n=1 Tax=Reticulomyxa filosa TaxID=46433 RepID=X6P1J1_RETFI|nr:hypothetical protein RFI_05707 [Reticulomyxa filosa]|eukprot:ETO31412.1 hypothetical protein RFI_05707 [Reticulomyxa filosa]